MTVRIAQFVHATHDVVDEAFLREFPEVEAIKADNLETLSEALNGAEIFNVYIPPSRRSSRSWSATRVGLSSGSSSRP